MIYKLVLWSVYFALAYPLTILQKLPQSPQESYLGLASLGSSYLEQKTSLEQERAL